ncbi:MAG: S8 family serine peptidase [Vicinamibacterales bacterium]
MPQLVVYRRARVALSVTLIAATFTVTGQEPVSPSPDTYRLVVREAGLPGIDRGLRDQDAMREPEQSSLLDSATVDGVSRLSAGESSLRGSVIVKFRDSAGPSAVSSTMSAVGATDLSRPSWADFELLAVPMARDPEEVAAELRARPDVEYAQPRYVNHAMFRPNDQFFDRQWNLTSLDMERAWDIQPGASSSIIVAVLDSGIAFRNVTLRYQARPFQFEAGGPIFPSLGIVDVPFAIAPELGDASRFVSPRDFIWNDEVPVDLDGHGTHVAGTVGQLTNNAVGVAGMAFNVRLMPVKVIHETWDVVFGSPNAGTDDVVARGIRYAADSGARVINMSFGRTAGGPAPAIEDAVRYAVSLGAFVAVAAGNSRETGNQPSRTAEAAPRIDGMVAVGAVGRDLSAAFYSTSNAYVELAAPGGDARRFGTEGGVLQQTLDLDLLETYMQGPARLTAPRADSFAIVPFQGTSMATPHVSGFAALLMQQGITSPAAIEAAMKQFATDKGPTGRDDEYGHGLINPRATLRGLGLAR